MSVGIYYVCVSFGNKEKHFVVVARSFEGAFWRVSAFYPNADKYDVRLCEFLDCDDDIGLDCVSLNDE